MPQLHNSTLRITIALPERTARVLVTGEIRFTENDLDDIDHGVEHQLTCVLWERDNGRDALIDPDNRYRFDFPQLFRFSDDEGIPPAVNEFRFETTVPAFWLDDEGDEEIYARLTLKNLETDQSVRTSTNTISHFNFN
jgi:hypothetical protein